MVNTNGGIKMVEKRYIVYKHTTPSGKCYIGTTCRNLNKRWRNGNGYKTQISFYRAIIKYGWDNINHEILFENLSSDDAKLKEMEMIAKYNSMNRDYGYNLTAGGDGMLGYTCTEEHRYHLSESHKGQKLSDEHKEKLRLSNIGRPSPMKGKKLSEETCMKISESNKGRICSEETRKKISDAQKGKSLDEKHYQNLCKAMKNEEIRLKMSKAQKGRKHSKETIQKISDTRRKKPVAQYDLSGHHIADYPSICDAAKNISKDKSNIARCCLKERKTAFGYVWKFIENG